MKAIVTKYHGPTDTRGSRITASDEDGNKCTIPYPYELCKGDRSRTDTFSCLFPSKITLDTKTEKQ